MWYIGNAHTMALVLEQYRAGVMGFTWPKFWPIDVVKGLQIQSAEYVRGETIGPVFRAISQMLPLGSICLRGS